MGVGTYQVEHSLTIFSGFQVQQSAESFYSFVKTLGCGFFSIYLFFAIWSSPNRPNGELHGDLTLLPEHISSASGILPLLMPR